MAAKRRSLGRNLEALLGDVTNIRSNDETRIEGDLKQIDIDHIVPGKYQPRRDFNETALNELADSIRAQGVIQPIVVRSVDHGRYELVAGERRWRAAKLAGLDTIPTLVRELPDEAAIAMALIENIQREDLNPIEEASALQRLIKEFAMTHEQVANAVGKSRTAVTNLLRLLSLPEYIKKLLAENKLEMGHARALLPLTESRQLQAAKTVIEKGLSVRETENLVKSLLSDIKPFQKNKSHDPALHQIQEKLAQQFAAKVAISQNAKGRGKLVINYKNTRHLEDILEVLLQE